ncbi:MAG: prepilin-type N-terminal cleavage/methylation domain-containing protein [Deltaproteobacteria bacterium]|nr:prepilin-type N-terminal cleavage/methylation domain-containing protein [Deltaproteobacteria bacterium]
MRAAIKSQNGFTLIETVLTLSITTVLLVAVLSALRLGISSWEKGEALVDKASIKRNVIYRLEREAASAYPYILKEKEKRIAFIGGSGSVGFVTTALTPSGIPGAKWVYYTSGNDGLQIQEKYLTAEDILSLEGGELAETESSVKSMKFEYLTKDGWKNDWEPRKEEVPRAIKAEIILKDESKLKLTVPFGSGQYGLIQNTPAR